MTSSNSASDSQTDSAPAPTGFPNVGNTCFLNSALQVYTTMYPGTAAAVRGRPPMEWVRWWEKASAGQYSHGHQDDAQAVLVALLDWAAQEGKDQCGEERSGCEFTVARHYECSACRRTFSLHRTRERFLFLEIPPGGGAGLDHRAYSLGDLLDYWSASSGEPGHRVPTAELCPEDGGALGGGASAIERAPDRFWVVHIHRYRYTPRGEVVKRQDRVAWPMRWVDGDREYALCAGLLHHGGSAQGGHYTAVVRRGRGSWWHCNDSLVVDAGDDISRLMEDAYVGVYERVSA